MRGQGVLNMLTAQDLEWSVGFLEGEGSFFYSGTSARVTATQKYRQSLRRLQRLFGGTIPLCDSKGISRWQLYGIQAVGLMMTERTSPLDAEAG